MKVIMLPFCIIPSVVKYRLLGLKPCTLVYIYIYIATLQKSPLLGFMDSFLLFLSRFSLHHPAVKHPQTAACSYPSPFS